MSKTNDNDNTPNKPTVQELQEWISKLEAEIEAMAEANSELQTALNELRVEATKAVHDQEIREHTKRNGSPLPWPGIRMLGIAIAMKQLLPQYMTMRREEMTGTDAWYSGSDDNGYYVRCVRNAFAGYEAEERMKKLIVDKEMTIRLCVNDEQNLEMMGTPGQSPNRILVADLERQIVECEQKLPTLDEWRYPYSIETSELELVGVCDAGV